MSLKQWIRLNRVRIDERIKAVCSNCRIDDDERALWVLNDETLYHMAKDSGVKI